MRANNRTIYKAHGIELVLVPGGDKLRVRLREDGESDNESGTQGDNGNEVEESEN